jgi:hypothetical protein
MAQSDTPPLRLIRGQGLGLSTANPRTAILRPPQLSPTGVALLVIFCYPSELDPSGAGCGSAGEGVLVDTARARAQADDDWAEFI